jgi:nucleoside-diphosphate-sugar epimerase/predicted dehydrogenase
MRVGMVGGGHIATIHGPAILKQLDTEIVGIVDRDVTRAKVLANKLKVHHVYQDARTMIDEQKPDLVHVLLPPQYHAEFAIMAMSHGCHVLVEKPMALTMADTEKMIEIATQHKVHLCVNHNLVFEKVVRQAIALASTGVIGEVVSVEACQTYDVRRTPAFTEEGAEYSHWSYRMNGGPLQDLMPHPASLIMEFLHDIKEVQSIGQNRGVLPRGWQDEIRVLIKSDSVLGYISISLNEKPDTIMLTIKGTKGTVHADLFNSILVVRKQSGLPRAVTRGLSGFQLTLQHLKGAVGNIYTFATGSIDKSGGIEPMISKFYDCVRHGGTPPISVDKSLRVVDLMNRIWPAPVTDVQQSSLMLHPTKKKDTSATALVTGASGFIGMHLVNKLLSEDVEIRTLVRPSSIHFGRLKKYDVDIVQGDLADAETIYKATEGIKTIYHVGAATNNSWEDNYQSTIKGTENLIQAAIAHKVERFIYISTITVYDLFSAKHGTKISESFPYPKNPKLLGAYTYSKIEAEKLLLNAYHQHGLKTTIMRPGMVIGPMGHIFFPLLGFHYGDRLFFIVGKGDNILPITYVENTVDCIYRASIEEKSAGQSYNIVDDGVITVRQYLECFIETTGIPARIVSVPYMVLYLATAIYGVVAHFGFLEKGKTSILQFKSKQAPVRFDNTKAKHEVGWTPRISVDEGLTRTFAWYANRSRH